MAGVHIQINKHRELFIDDKTNCEFIFVKNIANPTHLGMLVCANTKKEIDATIYALEQLKIHAKD